MKQLKNGAKMFVCLLCTLILSMNLVTVDAEAAYSTIIITSQPENYYGEYNTNVTFSVEAYSYYRPTLSYQWYYRQSENSSWVQIKGATSATLTSKFYRGMDGWQAGCLIYDGRTIARSEVAASYHISTQPEVPDEETPADDSVPVVEPVEPSEPDTDVFDDLDPDIDDAIVVDDDTVSDEDSDTVVDDKSDDTDAAPVDETTDDNNDSQIQEPTDENDTVDSTREYVTPEMYGAKGDGKTDDTAAIQKAVDSGKDVRFDSNKTYYIAAGNYIQINNKNDFRMSGGRIHKAASGSNYNLFVLKNCSNCVFENMYIYSEHTQKDILVPKDHTRPKNLSSNVLAFSGIGNSNITFRNNSFDNMSADYWFNGNLNGSWTNITVDGWKSSTGLLPMYAQFITNLTVTNADVSMNPEYAGNGDHCIYICTKSNGVLIQNSTFNWYGSTSVSGTTAALTFHGGSVSQGTQPKNITISNCTVNGGDGKTIYTGEGVTVTIKDSNVNYTTSATSRNHAVLNGYGSYVVENSQLSGYDTLVDARGTVTINNSTLTGAVSEGIFGTAPVVTCTNTTFNIGGGTLYYVSNGSGVAHSYTNCTINKASSSTKKYVVSKRSTAGTITFTNCSINCGGGMLMYNGGSVRMTGVTLNNTSITNATQIATANELSGLTKISTTLNGKSA